MLLANESKPGRERLTLKRVFEELCGLGYEGGYDLVRRYAKAWRMARGAVTAEAYVPLSFAPGEAYQFDWSPEVVLINVDLLRKSGGFRYECRGTRRCSSDGLRKNLRRKRSA